MNEMSLFSILVLTALYGEFLRIMVHMIRHRRLDTSLLSQKRFFEWVGGAHLLGIVICLGGIGYLVYLEAIVKVVGVAEVTGYAAAFCTIAFALGWFGWYFWWLSTDLERSTNMATELSWELSLTITQIIGIIFECLTGGILLMITATFHLSMIRSARISRQTRLLWTLSSACKRGIPLADEVQALSRGMWGKQRQRLVFLSENLRSGQPLSTALERQPGLLPKSVVMFIRMGEETGLLPQALQMAAEQHAETRNRQNDWFATNQLLGIFMVPFACLPIMVFFLSYWILPKYKKILEDFGAEMPFFSRMVMNLSGMDTGVAYLVNFGVVVSGFVTVYLIFKDWEGDWGWFDDWFPRATSPWILRCLSLCAEYQCSMLKAVEAMAWTHPRRRIRRRLDLLRDELEGGANLWETLQRLRLIRPVEAVAAQAAQAARNLNVALSLLADRQERLQAYRLQMLTDIVQTGGVCVAGLLVGTVVVAYFLPLIAVFDIFGDIFER